MVWPGWPRAHGRPQLEALTFRSRVNILVMGLLRIVIALYSAVLGGPRSLVQAVGPGTSPHQLPSPPLKQHTSLSWRFRPVSSKALAHSRLPRVREHRFLPLECQTPALAEVL